MGWAIDAVESFESVLTHVADFGNVSLAKVWHMMLCHVKRFWMIEVGDVQPDVRTLEIPAAAVAYSGSFDESDDEGSIQ